MASAAESDDGCCYSRKEKSLGMLCERFIEHFGGEYGGVISLDSAAVALDVKRRRIYDIVNVLESVDVIERLAKNTFVRAPVQGQHSGQAPGLTGTAVRRYAWRGLEHSAAAAPGEGGSLRPRRRVVGAARGARSTPASRDRWDKSLAGLTQRFVQLLVDAQEGGQCGTLSLHAAAHALASREERAEPAKMKTKVRRLYDIANVLTALGLVAKTAAATTRAPAFRWAGVAAAAGAHAPSGAHQQQQQSPGQALLGAGTPDAASSPLQEWGQQAPRTAHALPAVHTLPAEQGAVLAEVPYGPGTVLLPQHMPVMLGQCDPRWPAWAGLVAAGPPQQLWGAPPPPPQDMGAGTPPRFAAAPPQPPPS